MQTIRLKKISLIYGEKRDTYSHYYIDEIAKHTIKILQGIGTSDQKNRILNASDYMICIIQIVNRKENMDNDQDIKNINKEKDQRKFNNLNNENNDGKFEKNGFIVDVENDLFLCAFEWS